VPDGTGRCSAVCSGFAPSPRASEVPSRPATDPCILGGLFREVGDADSVLIEEGLVIVDVGNSVRKCINDWEYGELDAAMMHACFAVDGTRRKLYPDNRDNNTRFTKLLRDNYSILGPMGAPGVDLRSTRFPVRVLSPKAAGGQPDIADVIYGIHRCCHGHGEGPSRGFRTYARRSWRPKGHAFDGLRWEGPPE